MKKAIIVNGVSSAGCTGLVKRFCELSNDEYIGLHIDEFTNTLPKDMWKRCCDSDAGWAEIGIALLDSSDIDIDQCVSILNKKLPFG